MIDEKSNLSEPELGSFSEDSLEIDIGFGEEFPPDSSAQLEEEATGSFIHMKTEPEDQTIVIFEPLPYGIGAELKKAGYPVQEVESGVDVMQAVSTEATGLVICGPASDAEHRRLLTAAIRSRFPSLAIVYASTHAGDPRALDGAKAEGAHDVLQVPLPPGEELEAFFSRFGGIKKRPSCESAETTGLAQLKRPDQSQLMHTTLVDSASTSASQEIPDPVSMGGAPVSTKESDDAGEPKPEIDAGEPKSEIDAGEPKPEIQAARIEDEEPQKEPKEGQLGEIGSLLTAISPFLWGLEDAARWIETLEKEGNQEAMQHARTLQLLNGLLKQLKERIDLKRL